MMSKTSGYQFAWISPIWGIHSQLQNGLQYFLNVKTDLIYNEKY